MFASCDNDNPNDDGGNKNSPIVGMWRSKLYSSTPTVGVVFFNADGSYRSISYIRNCFYGNQGKYKLDGNTLEFYDLTQFQRHDNALSINHFGDIAKIWKIIGEGTRSEVLAIIDPNHSTWVNYGGLTGQVGWRENENWTATVEWIDDNTIDYVNNLRYPLERVR